MLTILLKKYRLLAIAMLCFVISLNYACNRGGDANEKKTETKQIETKAEKTSDLPAHCNNGLYDGDEIGIDCGGSCPTDCCSNKKFDNNLGEKGIDCGGDCPTSCCKNGILDATNGETDIDCGGPCKPCPKKEEEKKANEKSKKVATKVMSPLAKDLEKDLNDLAKQSDKKERRNVAKALNKKYAASQIIVVGKETKTYSIRDYTKNLNMLIGNKISIKVTNVQEVDGKLSVASITEK